MKAWICRIACISPFLLGASGTWAQGNTAPSDSGVTMQSKDSQERLDAMSRTPTWGHPDLYGEFAGMQRYGAGNYKAAMKYFLIGARFADKLSQLSIGLMYLNGEGVQKDPVAAFAWVALAAERKYPKFLDTRDAIWAGLDVAQREQAKAMVERLYPEYGDATAKPRLANRMRWARTQLTGSLLGGQIGPIASVTPAQFFNGSNLPGSSGGARMPDCGADTMAGLPITGCGVLANVKWYWNPKSYFEERDAEMTGTVTVGQLQQLTAKGDNTAPAPQKQK